MPLRLPALDPFAVPEKSGSGYPEPLRSRVAARMKRRLGDACGLTQFGVNLVTLGPGSESALRHWHTLEDEFVYILSGELVLVTNEGEQVLAAGMCAGYPAGARDAHHLVNRSARAGDLSRGRHARARRQRVLSRRRSHVDRARDGHRRCAQGRSRVLKSPLNDATPPTCRGRSSPHRSREGGTMADFPAPQTINSDVPVTATLIAYLLFGIGAVAALVSSGFPVVAPLFGVLGIVGVIIAYVKRDEARGTWVASHLRWLIRTFWYSLLWAVVGGLVLVLLGIVLIGIPIALLIWAVASIWVIYRVIKGYLLFKDSKAIPGM